MTQMSIDQAMRLARQTHHAGNLAEAERIYRQILAANPRHADALHMLGVLAGQVGKSDMAVDLIRRALAINPNLADAYGNLGCFLRDQGNLDEAIAACSRSVELLPQTPEAFNNLGNALRDKGRLDEALAVFRRAVDLDPKFDKALFNLGNTFADKDELEQAVTFYRRAADANPKLLDAHYNLGTALGKLSRFDEAVDALQRALALDPNHIDAMLNLGNAMMELSRFEEAVAVYERAIAAHPDHVLAHTNYGVALGRLGRQDDAIRAHRKALQLDPLAAEAHWNLAHPLLIRGEFAAGWEEYEWRWKVEGGLPPRPFTQPLWRGEALKGKTILLHAEQGFGDAIQFIRYAPMVAERGGKVLLECQPEISRLLKNCPGIERIISNGQKLPEFDIHCPLLSLPRVFKTDLGSIPAPIPYVHADSELSRQWKERLNQLTGELKIGLVWAGRPGHRNDRSRSIPLELFAPLGSIGADILSLQKGEAANQMPPSELKLINWTNDLLDFAETAALVEHLDVVICVDTAVAHLAGAMGRPIWLLLPNVPEWRWLLDRSDSPWYPTMRLFRQKSAGNWSGVIDEVAQQLRSLPNKPT